MNRFIIIVLPLRRLFLNDSLNTYNISRQELSGKKTGLAVLQYENRGMQLFFYLPDTLIAGGENHFQEFGIVKRIN